MLAARLAVGVVHARLGGPADLPVLHVGLVVDDVLGLHAVDVGEDKAVGAGLELGRQLLLEGAGEELSGHDGLDDVAADEGELLAVGGENAAVFVDHIVLSVRREACAVVGVGLQGVEDEIEGEIRALDARGHDVLVRKTDGRVGVGQGHAVEVLALLDHAVGHVTVGDGVLLFRRGQDDLRLDDGVELLIRRGNVAELAVLDGAGVFLVLDVDAVELLVFLVGADDAADEGKDEHEGQDAEAHDRDAVAEKALGDHGARRQDLDAAVVVEGILLFFGGSGNFFLFEIFVHFRSSFLMRCVRADRPRRTGCPRSGCPAA